MSQCLDEDGIVSVGNAIGWEVDRVRHLSECDECRSLLKQLGRMHLMLSDEVQPGTDFTDSVVAALPERRRRMSDLVTKVLHLLATPVLAGLTAFFSAALVNQGVGGATVGPPMIVLVAATTIGMLIWNVNDSKRDATVS